MRAKLESSSKEGAQLQEPNTTGDLRSVLEGGERATVEFKTTLADTRRIIETLAAMATIGGGTLLVGVRDDGRPVGFNPGQGELERLVQQVMAATDPRLYVDIDRPELDGVQLLRVRVSAGDGPHLAFGRAFYRSGPATVAMTRDEYERRLLDRTRESSGYEQRSEPSRTVYDVAVSEIARFCTQAASRMAEPPCADEPGILLDRLHLRRGEQLTVAGVLLFGREPQAPFPQAVIRARATRGSAEDSRSIEGSLFHQIEEAVAFVARNLRSRADRSKVVREEQPELPLAAVREVVANAVAHRDYRSVAPIQLRLTDEALTLWNPGHLPPPLTPASLREDHPSIPPNPHLARALYLAGYIEEWGTGTLRMIEALRTAGNPPPLFESTAGDGLRVVLPLPGAPVPGLPARLRETLDQLPVGRSFRSADYAQIAGVAQRTASLDLGVAEDAGLVRRESVGRALRWVKVG